MSGQIGVPKNYRNREKTPEMNVSELDLICNKTPDEKYYFLAEKYFSTKVTKPKTLPFLSKDEAFPLDFTHNLILGLNYGTVRIAPPSVSL